MGRQYNPPTDLIHLRAWIASSTLYTFINHTKTPFPCVNDFTSPELEEVLRYGMETFARLKTELTLEDAKTAALFSPGIISQIPEDAFPEMVLAAKYGDELMYENCVVGLAMGIKKLKDELVKARQPRMDLNAGDEDDWFLPGIEEGVVQHEEIEIGWLPGSFPI